MFIQPLILFPLAQPSNIGGVIGWSLVLIVLLIIGAAGVLRLRRWMKEDDLPAGGIGFTLSDLRQLHKQGKMTDAEFEKAKEMMLGGARKLAESLPHPLSPGPAELQRGRGTSGGAQRPPPPAGNTGSAGGQ